MKPINLTALLSFCLAAVTLAFSHPPSACAGAPTSDDIIIFRAIYVERSIHWYQPEGDEPIGKNRDSYRERGYLILNLATGEYRTVNYRTDTELDGKRVRVRVKRYEESDGDEQMPAIFQTGPDHRRNYLILSL